jgi:hypothetical protein
MPCGHTSVTKVKKNYRETANQGQFWRATMVDMESRLRVARGIAKTETQASVQVFRTLQRRGHPDAPPATVSDGWGGIDDAMLEVYGQVPVYKGIGRPPTHKQPQPGWQYLQVVKHRNAQGRITEVELRVVYGDPAAVLAFLGKSTAYVERTHLTMRHFNSRLGRKTIAFSKELQMHQAAATWDDFCYNLIQAHKSLRQVVVGDPPHRWRPRTPAMAARLTNHVWTVKELLTTLPVPSTNNT